MRITIIFLASLFSLAANADTDCSFVQHGHTEWLHADCSTTETLFIPDGFTLIGSGHKITAKDPAGGSFSGAVVQNAGATANVQDLVITTDALATVCHGPPNELAGVALLNASGSVVGVTVDKLAQPGSGCQEGNAIEVRNTSEATQQVLVVGNRLIGYQKTGLVLDGPVTATVTLNQIQGLGPISYIAQNGIQVSDGATATIRLNTISDNVYTGTDTSAVGILLATPAKGVVVELNLLTRNDIGVYLYATTGATVHANDIHESTYAAIYSDPTSSGNHVSQ